jgi:hypothetical protein
LPGFVVSQVPGEQWPACVLNENPPEGLFDTAIKHTQSWSVTFKWRTYGVTSDAMGPAIWHMKVYLDKLSGPGGAQLVRELKVPYKITSGPDNYSYPVEIPAGAVADGVYKLYTAVDLESPAIVPVTLFGEGPLMKFYTP